MAIERLSFEPRTIVSPPSPTLQVTRTGARINLSPARFGELHDAFEREHIVILPGFFSPEVLAAFQARLPTARWRTRIHDRLTPPAIDLALDEPDLLGALYALLNDPPLHRAIERITDCPPIQSWYGAVYRMDAAGGHHDTWHSDMIAGRRVAISVNLSDAPFDGGELSMRHVPTGRTLWTVHNTGPGDALLFRLHAELEHFVHAVSGPVPKTALAGWFRDNTPYWPDALSRDISRG